MADELDETLEDRVERVQRRAANFLDLLKDGDEVTLARHNGEMFVEESYRSKFERKHAKLFGRMLSIEEQMRGGTFPYFLGLLAFAAFVGSLQLGWWEGVLGARICQLLDNWWFYIPGAMAILYLVYVGSGRLGTYVYRRHRQALLDLIAAEGLDRDELLVSLRDQDDLDHVIYHLKLDTRPTS